MLCSTIIPAPVNSTPIIAVNSTPMGVLFCICSVASSIPVANYVAMGSCDHAADDLHVLFCICSVASSIPMATMLLRGHVTAV